MTDDQKKKLQDVVDSINACGGVVHDTDNDTYDFVHESWLDLATDIARLVLSVPDLERPLLGVNMKEQSS